MRVKTGIGILALWLQGLRVSHHSMPLMARGGHGGDNTPVSFLARCLTHGRCSVCLCHMNNCANGREALDKGHGLSGCQFSHW